MVAAKTATILVIWAYCLFINSLEENFMFMKRLLIILFILTLVTSSSCKSHSLVESLPKLTNENKFWEETFEIGSSICNINASIEYISAPMQIYNVVPVNFNIKNLKRYLMYFGVSTDSFVSFPFIADCQTNSDLAASVVLTATYCITN